MSTYDQQAALRRERLEREEMARERWIVSHDDSKLTTDKMVTPEDRIGVARTHIADARRTLKQMRHTGLCSCFVDQAPEGECDCQRSAVLAWLDHIETPLTRTMSHDDSPHAQPYLVDELITDKMALDAIATAISCEEWSVDTMNMIAGIVRQTGREIRNYE